MDITKEHLKITKDMDKENIYGKMERVIQENGSMVLKMGLESGNQAKEIVTSVNGLMAKLKVMAYISLQLDKDIKDSLYHF